MIILMHGHLQVLRDVSLFLPSIVFRYFVRELGNTQAGKGSLKNNLSNLSVCVHSADNISQY